MSTMNKFAVLGQLSEKKKTVVVTDGTRGKTKKEKAPASPKEPKAAPKKVEKEAPADKKKPKEESTPAPEPVKVGGPSSLAKVALLSEKQKVEEEEKLKLLAEKKALAEERKKKRQEDFAAKKAASGELTEEEATKKAEEAKKREEEEKAKVSMKEYEKELAARRFKTEEKTTRHVDAAAFSKLTQLKNAGDEDAIFVAKKAEKPEEKKGSKKPASAQAKTAPKPKKAETKDFFKLANELGVRGGRGSRGRGGLRGGHSEANSAEQAVPSEAAFPEL